MKTWLCFSALLAAMSVGVPAPASQTATPQPATKADYSQEAYVVEQMATRIDFDNDGKRTRQQTTRVKINTDSGVQQWGLLSMPYQSATETVAVDYVRVRKPDQTVITTPDDNVQDLDAEITRSAPFYSDLREKHIAVKGLAKGDVLEYQIEWHPIKALIPGQFWLEYNFQKSGIVLNEEVEMRVPADRPVKFKGPQATQSITTEGAARIYRWTRAKLDSTKDLDNEKKKAEAARGQLPSPDVQLSSFQTWKDVGEWYWSLQKDRAQPSDAVRAKAAELTKGLTDDAAKLQAIYHFVSIQYRYIGIAFGIGRYQPHAADDVLGNNYGDCKDKHTLLAALLDAAGIKIYPALIASSRRLDEDVPSPGQFDHIIGYLPQGKSGMWLDTTPEVAPAGYLVQPLRDKLALVMEGPNEAELIRTPENPPFETRQTFKIDGKVNDDGSFEAHVDDTSHGDGEVLLRAAFRRVPEPQWKDLVQQISYALGYAGTVSAVTASAPDKLGEPFHFAYAYNRKEYPDWTNHQFSMPGHPFYMPPIRDDAKDEVWLGSPAETVSESKVELPKGYKPVVPSNVDLVYGFAEYHATYSQDHDALKCTRRLVVKHSQVPVAELQDYRTFLKNLQNDVNRYVQTTHASAEGGPPLPLSLNSAMFGGLSSRGFEDVRRLPDSNSSEANRMDQSGLEMIQQSDLSAAAVKFKQAVELDPKFTRGWLDLASAEMAQQQLDGALDSCRNAIDNDPQSLLARRMYAILLLGLRRYDASLQAWKEVLRLKPDDLYSMTQIVALLMQAKRYQEALPYAEAEAKADISTGAQLRLGILYLKAGQTEKGSAVLQKTLESDSKPETLNNVAYELADAKIDVSKALEYAQRAVGEQERESQNISLSSLLDNDLACTNKIGMFWDTLGWAEFRAGDLPRAEEYLNAAWLLTQGSVIGDHLGQVYEAENKREEAIRTYQLAGAAPDVRSMAGDESKNHLLNLGVKPYSALMPVPKGADNPGEELSRMRTIKLKKLIPGTASAEFFLLLNHSAKVEQASFISGSEELRSATDALENVDLQMTLPQGSSAKLVRRGILMCSKLSGCNLVLMTPSSVHSVK